MDEALEQSGRRNQMLHGRQSMVAQATIRRVRTIVAAGRAAGLCEIEAGSFVHPRGLPPTAGAEHTARVAGQRRRNGRDDHARFSRPSA